MNVPDELWETVVDEFSEGLEKRFSEASDWWGNDSHESLWPMLHERLVEDMRGGVLDDADPKTYVDNFLVNGEIVEKGEFREDGEWNHYFSEYDGDWERLREDAIVSDNEYALMRY